MNSNFNNQSNFGQQQQTIILPTVVHEEIREELVEEVQPVIEVEKFKTEVHQVTQPLFDKEIRPVTYEQKTLNTEILQEVAIQGRGISLPSDQSSVNYLDTTYVVVEKPARFIEVERNQVIEEIQPVIYKETIVPSVIQETKPVYQKIVEGPTYIQETMPSRDISGSGFYYNQPQQNFGQQQAYLVESIGIRETPTEIIPAIVEEPVVIEKVIPIPPPAPLLNNNNKKKFHFPRFGKKHNKTVETTTRTVTTTDRPALAVSNELLYADGVSGGNTILDGADPFNRDYLLADNPITHNEFARQPQDHHLPLTTAGPYLTSEPSIGGYHSRLVTPLGNGGDHYVDPARNSKLASKSRNILNNSNNTTNTTTTTNTTQTQNPQVTRI